LTLIQTALGGFSGRQQDDRHYGTNVRRGTSI
jgi:hypothetical protein